MISCVISFAFLLLLSAELVASQDDCTTQLGQAAWLFANVDSETCTSPLAVFANPAGFNLTEANIRNVELVRAPSYLAISFIDQL